MVITACSICYICYGAKFMEPRRTFIEPKLIRILIIWLVAVTGFTVSITIRDTLEDSYYPDSEDPN